MLQLAVLPAVILLVYVYRLDPMEKEPAGLLLSLLLCGMLSTFPAVLLELLGTEVFLGGGEPNDLETLAFENFIIVALVEEGCKFFFLRWRTWKDPHFDYVFDGIVYAVFVGLGFAIAENILYVFNYGISVAFVRAVTAIPGHCMFGIFMGCFYGKAKLADAKGNAGERAGNQTCTILVPVFCHGSYDTLASIDSDLSSLLFFALLVLMVVTGIRLMKRMSAQAERISWY